MVHFMMGKMMVKHRLEVVKVVMVGKAFSWDSVSSWTIKEIWMLPLEVRGMP